MAGQVASPKRRRAWHAFTLIETPLVVLMIAVLLDLLLPGIASARDRARAVACLSNLRGLHGCWSCYSEDYRAFPCGPLPSYVNSLRLGWGGVDWYGDDGPPGIHAPPDRPLNPYVASTERIEVRTEVFKCPSDTGCAMSVTGERAWAAYGAGNASGEGERTCFGLAGTSYEANTWMYCVPVAPSGWGFAPSGMLPPRFRSNQSYASIPVEPARFIVLGEIGAMTGGRLSRTERASRNIFTGFWHGEEFGHLAFADGSARREKMGAVTTGTYTFHMAPWKYDWTSWRWPDQQR